MKYNDYQLEFDSVLLTSQLLTNHYERCWKYYCLAGGWGSYGAASEEELHLSRKLFWGIFDALSCKVRLLNECFLEHNFCKAAVDH